MKKTNVAFQKNILLNAFSSFSQKILETDKCILIFNHFKCSFFTF